MGTDTGFHGGEIAVQRQAGVRHEAARLSRMLEPTELSGGIARFLAERTFLALTARDGAGRLWTTAVAGRPGLLEVRSGSELAVHAGIAAGDPLTGLAAGQQVGTTSVDFARQRRVRINGTLTVATAKLLVVDAEQAYGNCPQFIQPRLLAPDDAAPPATAEDDTRHGTTPEPADLALIRAADTFFLGTAHPDRGADASHRGGPPGFVRVDDRGLWWPDYPGNNMFNSLGNLAVNPEAALLFPDFATGGSLHLSGTARIEWGEAGRPGDDGHSGRLIRFRPHHLVATHHLALHEVAHRSYAHNPPLTSGEPHAQSNI
ncbi:pyridoxamine 5'-phosphate oxidase family protein [Actinoplanes sp. NPDC020271]|uniref:pyridoxamine 5'-phosphate oxidase family protein n=1 Tax=Actinoplanes sp. NPDC020271 TaxID=3363896 RepID=UPI0037930DB9